MLDRKYEMMFNVAKGQDHHDTERKLIEVLSGCGLHSFHVTFAEAFHNGVHASRWLVSFFVTGEASPDEPVFAMQTATLLAKEFKVDQVFWSCTPCHTGWGDAEGTHYISDKGEVKPLTPTGAAPEVQIAESKPRIITGAH